LHIASLAPTRSYPNAKDMLHGVRHMTDLT